MHEDPETADRMITGLSELLREALIAGDRQQVPLRRELELVRRYLDIQQESSAWTSNAPSVY